MQTQKFQIYGFPFQNKKNTNTNIEIINTNKEKTMIDKMKKKKKIIEGGCEIVAKA